MGAGRRDFVSLVEVAYQAELDERRWLARLVEVASRALGFDCPMSAYVADASDANDFRAGDIATCGIAEEPLRLLNAQTRTSDPTSVVRLYSSHPRVLLLSECLRGVDPNVAATARRFLSAMGFRDVVGIRGLGVDRRGLMLCAMLPLERPLAARTRGALAHIARHFAAAHRLRHKTTSAEAILTRSGRVEHAEPHLRERRTLAELTTAAQRLGLARGKLRRQEPEQAVELWRALVAGRWSIVETVESDGKRFLLARPNELGLPHPRALTAAEGQAFTLAAAGHSNKSVAYELGLSPSRVSELLRGAMRKLGVRSRAELASYPRELPGAQRAASSARDPTSSFS